MTTVLICRMFIPMTTSPISQRHNNKKMEQKSESLVPKRDGKSYQAKARGRKFFRPVSDSIGGSAGTRETEGLIEDFTELFGEVGKHAIKPSDQLVLTEKELHDKITRILTTNKLHVDRDVVVFSFKDKSYVPVVDTTKIDLLYHSEGNIILPEQQKRERRMSSVKGMEGTLLDQKVTFRNKFNFYSRASQTSNNPCKSTALMTEPPVHRVFSANVTQWKIFDAYNESSVDQEKGQKTKPEEAKFGMKKETHAEEIAKMLPKLRIMERMVNHNIIDDITQDYKYWEDPSDEFRDEGNILPLWKFPKPNPDTNVVTCLVWSHCHADLFAVGLGSYEFPNQDEGEICLFSLKCPSYPDKILSTASGVFSLDFHHDNPDLLAAGLVDGTVEVYDLKSTKPQPLYSSSLMSNKHFDPVWEVKWLQDNLDGYWNFASVSADGRIAIWFIIKDELKCTDLMMLKCKTSKPIEGPEGIILDVYSSGTALSFNPFDESLFVVGTEEGLIHKCSSQYSGRYLMTYKYHVSPIHSLQWNPLHPRAFITCGADWLVCIWDHNKKDPVFEFDLKSRVNDVSWAPYSSTLFAAITEEGKIHIYDLNVNKQRPICLRGVFAKKKSKPYHITFNAFYPIIIIGDNNGNVSSYKLSPNLRKNLTDKTKMDSGTFKRMEEAKMEKLLSTSSD